MIQKIEGVIAAGIEAEEEIIETIRDKANRSIAALVLAESQDIRDEGQAPDLGVVDDELIIVKDELVLEGVRVHQAGQDRQQHERDPPAGPQSRPLPGCGVPSAVSRWSRYVLTAVSLSHRMSLGAALTWIPEIPL